MQPLHISYKAQVHKHVCYSSPEAFAATEFNEIFSGTQPRQDVKFFRRFGNYFRVKMATALFPETSENLHILRRPSARENLIECVLLLSATFYIESGFLSSRV